ncbi:MAG: GIY-YIG nuclease family protein [Pseudomonadota bacterium]
MDIDRDKLLFTCLGEPIDGAPRCSGVYRLYGENDVLLYIGKSIDIGTRLNSHFADARMPGRPRRMMSSVVRVDCEPTVGDVSAQFIENAAIKAEAPLYNRRQRRPSKLWTQRLASDGEGFLRVLPSDFSPAEERRNSVYGLFRSRTQLYRRLREIARDQGLCLIRLGVERGHGACFQSQVGRCRGACRGLETAETHNRRLLAALERQRIAAWPFPGPVILAETRAVSQSRGQPEQQLHLLNHWCYLGTFLDLDAARRYPVGSRALHFDRDAYHVAARAMRIGACDLLDAGDGSRLDNPLNFEGERVREGEYGVARDTDSETGRIV